MIFYRFIPILLVLLLFIGCEEDVPLSPQAQTSSEMKGAVLTETGGGRATVKTMTYNAKGPATSRPFCEAFTV